MRLFVSFLTMGIICLLACSKKRNPAGYTPELYFSSEELPIGKAIYTDNKKELKDLLKQKNTNLNQPGKEGYTYLQYAIDLMNYRITELLLENGADANVVSPLTYIPGAGKQPKPNPTVCIETVCYSKYNIKYLKLLVRYGADVNEKRAGSALSRAIEGDQQNKIDFLLKNGADVNIISEENTAPLIKAARLGRFQLMTRFLDLGADPFIEDKGISLQKAIQYNIQSTEGSPDNKERKRNLIRRLEALGMEFDFSKAKFKMED